MTDEKKDNQDEKTCDTGKCFGKNKIILGVLVGLLLVGSGFAIAKFGCCAAKVCPLSQSQTK